MSLGGGFWSAPVEAQGCTPSGSVSNCLLQCEYDPDGDPKYGEGQEEFKECTDTCQTEILDAGGSQEKFLECAKACESYVDPAYFQCADECLTEVDDSELTCWCQTDSQWLGDYSASCQEVLAEEEGEEGVDYLGVLFPECSRNTTKSAEGLMNCLRSVTIYVFFLAIAVFFARAGYVAMQSTMSFKGSSLTQRLKETGAGLIIGIIFIGMPNLILNIVNPNRFVTLGFLAELNLDQDLIDPFPGAKEKTTECDGEPEGQDAEVVYSANLDGNGDIFKYPQIAIDECQLHVVSTSDQEHRHWDLPIFKPEELESRILFPRTDSRSQAYIHARVTVGPQGVVAAAAQKGGLTTALWEEDSWKVFGPDKTKITDSSGSSGRQYVGGIVATSGGWLVTLKMDRVYQYALSNADEPVSFDSLSRLSSPTGQFYRNDYHAASSPDAQTTVLAAPDGSIFAYPLNGSSFGGADMIYKFPEDGSYAAEPRVAIGPEQEVYVAYRTMGDGVHVATQSGGAWTWEKVSSINDASFNVALAVDEEGGVHLAVIDRSGEIEYWYKASGGSWELQLTEGVGGFVANASGIAYAGERPYMAVVIEDWQTSGVPPKLYLFAAKGG